MVKTLIYIAFPTPIPFIFRLMINHFSLNLGYLVVKKSTPERGIKEYFGKSVV